MAELNPTIQCSHCGREFIRLINSEDRPPVCPSCLAQGHDLIHGKDCAKCRVFAAQMAEQISNTLKRAMAAQK